MVARSYAYRSDKVGKHCDTVVKIATWWRGLGVDALSDKSGRYKSQESERSNIIYPRPSYTQELLLSILQILFGRLNTRLSCYNPFSYAQSGVLKAATSPHKILTTSELPAVRVGTSTFQKVNI
jgi:hypothetical protein